MNDEILKMIVTLRNSSLAFESLRLLATNEAKTMQKIEAEIIDKLTVNTDLTEDVNYIRNEIQASVKRFVDKIQNIALVLNGKGKPGVIPMGIQLELFTDGDFDHDMIESVYDPSRRIAHRSGMFQPPLSLQESSL